MRTICFWGQVAPTPLISLVSCRRGLLAGAMLCLLCARLAGAYEWPQYNGDPQHSGNNAFETALGAGNVGGLTLKYHVALPAVADGAPVFLDGATTPTGVRDLLFITTKAGDLVAIDAHSGALIWSVHYPNALPAASCSGNECLTPSSPAIDPKRKYVYAYGLDGYLHKLQVGDGVEISGGGWPQLSTLKPGVEKQSGALAVASVGSTSYLYTAMSAHNGDGGDAQGHLTTVNLNTGAQSVFNFVCASQSVHFALSPATPSCSSRLAGGWARPGVIYDAGTNRIFAGTGNGSYNAVSNWGDSIVALNTDGSGAGGKPIDAYTPTNQAALDSGDTDLGSTAPAILPVPAASRVQHLAVQGGKDAKLRLINLADLSGSGGPGHLGGEIGAIIDVPQGGMVKTQPAVWVNPTDASTWVFVVNSNGAAGLKLVFDAAGNPSLATQWHNSTSGASPLVANNVLYFAGSGLRALEPTSGSPLWSTTQIGSIHWQSPVVACSAVYVLDQSSQLSKFALTQQMQSIVAGGNDQSAAVGASFGAPFSVLVTDANNAPQSGIVVTFNLPGSGASGAFAGGAVTATATTNANGIATSPAVSANLVAGQFIATAGVAGGACAANFHLTSTTAKYASLMPTRILDTRAGQSTVDGMFEGMGPVAAGGKLDLIVANRGGIARDGVGAVVLNVTATNPTSVGYVTVWPTGAARPNASNLNFVPGQTVPNLVVAKVGDGGVVSMFNSLGNTDLIADVAGWFPTTSGFTALNASRLLDTRTGSATIDGQYSGVGAVTAGGELDVAIRGRGGVPTTGVSAVVLNVTATNPSAPGYLTVWPAGNARPFASNLNFVPGQTVPNLVVAGIGASGKVAFYNSAGTTDLVADVAGWFASTSELSPLPPFRLLDTRTGAQTGDGQYAGSGRLGAGVRLDLLVAGRGGIPGTGVGAVVLNVTAVSPSAEGYVTVWPSASPLPMASNLNFTPGEVVPNLVITKVGADGKVSIYNSAGSNDIVVDVMGWFASP